MIVPKRHVSDLSRLNREERIDLFDLLIKTKELLAKKLNPNGFNIGINLGKGAGAGITGQSTTPFPASGKIQQESAML